MGNNLYTKVPEPPEQLGAESRKTWYMAGLNLVKEGRFTDDAYQQLEDLCYWEEQKLATLDKLRAVELTPGSPPIKMTRSVALKNLKTIKAEIDRLRSDLNLEQEESAWISESQPISDEAYKSIPDSLSACCDLFSDASKRDLFLLTSLPALAAYVPGVLAEHADGFYDASLNLFLIDSSGTAESTFKKVLRYLDAAPEKNAAEEATYPRLFKSYKSASSHYSNQALTEIQLPAAVYEANSEMQWEADSDIREFMMQAFENTLRAKSSAPVNNPFIAPMSGCILGDLNRYRDFWSACSADTNASFLLYLSGGEPVWQSHRPDTASRALVRGLDTLKSDMLQITGELSARQEPLVIELSEGQWQMIDDTFAEKMEIIEELGLPAELQKTNYNAAVYALKLAVIFSVMRQNDTDPGMLSTLEFLVPDDQDVIAALWIADTCLKHAIRVFEQLPIETEPDAKGERYHKFYNVLPPAFETAEAVELAEKMNIANRTAKRYLNTLIDEQKLTRIRKGQYEKIK